MESRRLNRFRLTYGTWFADEAEANHLAPLLDAFLHRHPHDAPETVVRQIQALTLRHVAFHRARSKALLEILGSLERLSIQALVLKGAALAWMIYPLPALRPMADIDLLVPRAAAHTAQAALGRLGFRADPVPRRFGRNAHHLPVASRTDGKLTISVEIHVDALSRDTLSSIALSNLSESPQPFLLDGVSRFTLGHVDMLRHLTHHLLEPTSDGLVRIISVIDLLGYATRFHDRIDWERLEKQFAVVINALGCLHYVVPLPPELSRFVPRPPSPHLARVGETMRPLRLILARGRPLLTVYQELFNPPEWWMHAYYKVPPAGSLNHVRLLRHPWRVARWLGLRIAGF